MTNDLNRKCFVVIAIVIANVFNYLECGAQTYSTDDFVKIPIPKAEGIDWMKYNQLQLIPFEVTIAKGKLRIGKCKDMPLNKYRLPHGTLLAIDRGEFGGGLYYKPDDSSQTNFYVDGKQVDANETLAYYRRFFNGEIPFGKYVLIKNGNINQFFSYNDSLYFTEGIDHMGFDHGALSKLECKGDSFKVVRLLSFDDAPHVAYVHKNKILIATFKKFYVIENWHQRIVFDNLFWYGFNPESIAVDDNENVYVGMFGFYAKIDLTINTMELYKYN